MSIKLRHMLFPTALLLAVFLTVVNPVQAQDDAYYIAQTFKRIENAQLLMQRAQGVLAQGLNRRNLESALNLYIQAGQHLEQSYNVMLNAGSEYFSAQDMQGCRTALEQCLQTIAEIKSRLAQTRF